MFGYRVQSHSLCLHRQAEHLSHWGLSVCRTPEHWFLTLIDQIREVSTVLGELDLVAGDEGVVHSVAGDDHAVHGFRTIESDLNPRIGVVGGWTPDHVVTCVKTDGVRCDENSLVAAGVVCHVEGRLLDQIDQVVLGAVGWWRRCAYDCLSSVFFSQLFEYN